MRTHDEDQIAQIELRQAAFQVAGRAIVHGRLGGAGRGEVWPNTREGVEGGEKAWLGAFRVFADPGVFEIPTKAVAAIPGYYVRPLPENWRVLVGLSGLVSECLANAVSHPHDVEDTIRFALENDESPESVLGVAGDAWTLEDVEETIRLLETAWSDVERKAQHVMDAAQAR